MSWDAIIAALGTAGTAAGTAALTASPTSSTDGGVAGAKAPTAAPAASTPIQQPTPQAPQPGIGSKISNTMIGQTPRTDSIPNFTGDVMQGLTNPHGLVGQAVRLLGAVASFGQGVPQGMQYLGAVNAADAAERANLANSAARGWTPEEHRTRTGQPVPPGTETSLQARDMPMSESPDSPQASPSAPDRVQAIQFPNTPEELTAARDAEFKYQRSLPNFGVGTSSQAVSQGAERAQRSGLPLSASEGTALTEQARGRLPGDSEFRARYDASAEGLKASFAELPPEDRSMDLEAYNRVTVPTGYEKIPIPDQKNPDRLYMRIVNTKTGMDFWDIAMAAGRGEPWAKDAIDEAKGFYADRGKAAALGSQADVLTKIEDKIGRELTPDQIDKYQAIKSGKFFKPEDEQKALDDWYAEVGYKEDPAESAAAAGNEKTGNEIWNALKKEREGGGQQQQPSGPATPGYPNAQGTPGRPGMTPGGMVESASPNAPPVVPKLMGGSPQSQKKQRTFDDLQPADVQVVGKVLLDILTKQGPDAAISKLKSFVNASGLTLSEAEKEFIAFDVIQNLGLKASAEQELIKKARAEIN